MKKFTSVNYVLILSAIFMFGLASCNKTANVVGTSTTKTTTSSTLATTTGNILIAVSSTSSTTAATKDSVVLMGVCPAGPKPDTIAFSALPAAIDTYLTADYSGYTFQKAFKVLKAGVLDSYVVVINYNGKPVGLKFDATGTFVAVLEQREPADIAGPGYHPGGRFDDRNGLHGDTIAVSALPAAIKSYFATNYPTDTLVHAVVTKDTTYIVFSTNKALFATSFTAKLVFSNRVQLNPRPVHVPVTLANLPAAVTAYLTTTYTGYVFDKAFAEKVSGTIDKYVVLIDASGTRYAVEFDGSGVFVKAITIK